MKRLTLKLLDALAKPFAGKMWFHKPAVFQNSEDFFDATVEGLLKYRHNQVTDFWEGYEKLVTDLYEYSDQDLLKRISNVGLLPEDVQDSDVENEKRVKFYSNEEDIKELMCPRFEFKLNIPCSMKACPYYTPYMSFNCSFTPKNDIITPFEVIAYRMQMSVDEVTELYKNAVAKIQGSELSSIVIEPHWDLYPMEGKCSLCTTDLSALGNKFKVIKEHPVCSECLAKHSSLGAKLIIRFKRELKSLLVEVSKNRKSFQDQANVLGVPVSALNNLYNVAGLNRSEISYTLNKNANIMMPRPGRSVIFSNDEYIAMQYIAGEKIFGTVSPKVKSKVKSMLQSLKKHGIDVDTVI